MKNTTVWARCRRSELARSRGRMSSIEAPVVPATLASSAPAPRKAVFAAGVERTSPSSATPPEITNSAPRYSMNEPYSAMECPSSAAPRLGTTHAAPAPPHSSATIALLRLLCHQCGTASGSTAMATSSRTKGTQATSGTLTRLGSGMRLAPALGPPAAGSVVGATGLEPVTPSLSSWCSSQLSYAPGSRALRREACCLTVCAPVDQRGRLVGGGAPVIDSGARLTAPGGIPPHLKDPAMKTGVPTEIKPSENRVAMVPAGVDILVRDGHEVFVQQGAGVGSGIPDADYVKAGAKLLATADEVWAQAEMIVKVKEP